jgi:GDP-4-dehydro-6-deoxy-D-mannose reductase
MTDDTGATTARGLSFRRILVTGARGFVGRQLIPTLARRLLPGARIFLATRSGGPAPQSGHTSISFDLEDSRSITAAIAEVRPDLVVHLAGQASVGQSVEMAAATWSINLCGSLALAKALAGTVPDCTVLFTSSVEVYGLTFNYETAAETSVLRPQSAYACSKAAAEAMFADVLPAGAKLIVARASNHSGPGQSETYVIPAFAAQIARIECGASPEIRVGNLDAERDFLDVRDIVNAYLALLANAERLPPRSTFNIASGRPVRIGTLLDRLRALSPVNTIVEPDPLRMRPSEVLRTAIDASKIMHGIGWTPTYSLDDTLSRVLAAQRELNGSRVATDR